MATLSIDWERSPRIIIVDAPDTEISAQEIVDLCRDAEDDVANSSYERLVSASGKEPLGGGTTVGITVEMQNAKIGFEGRHTTLETGTVTTPDTTGITLTDSTALFETNLVEIGDLIINTTDGSHCTIVEVTSETSVLTTGLGGGTDNQFAFGDAYEVWEIIPCEITGGNVVAVDSVGAELDPVLPTFGTYAKVSKASTGTLSEQGDIQHASYDGGVHVDVTSAVSGSEYPAGNSANPVNNWPDAVIINAREGFNQYFVEKSTTLDVTQDYTDASFVGKSIIDTVLTIPAGSILDKAEFFNVSIEGTLGDVTIMQHCFLGETNTLNDVQGVIEECSIGPAKLTLGGLTTEVVRFVNCRGAGQVLSPPTINCGGNGPEIDIQDYVGRLNIENKTGGAVLEISIVGELILDATVTSGPIILNGTGTFVNNSSVPDADIQNNMVQGIQLQELWRLQGLEFGNPMTVTPTTRSLADSSINLALTGDGETSTTVTRQTDQTLTFNVPLTADLLDTSDSGLTPTFARASTGTYFNNGTSLITNATVDSPRFEIGGLLIEESRTNVSVRVEEFDYTPAWGVTNATISANNRAAPDGTTTADDLIDDAVDSAHYVEYLVAVLTVGSTWSWGAFVKYVDQRWILSNSTNSESTTYFDILNGTVGSQNADGASIDGYDDWYRVGVTHPVGATRRYRYYLANADGDAGYIGSSERMGLWGSQAEEGEFLSSYIPTTTATVTRSPDYLTYNDDSVVLDAEGSIYCEITPEFSSTTANDAVIVNIANVLQGVMYVTDDTTQKVAIHDGTNTATYDPTFVRGQTYKCAVRWNSTSSEMQVIVNGVGGTKATYDGNFVRTPGTLYVGSTSSGNHLNGNIRNLRIYNVDRGETQLLVDTA